MKPISGLMTDFYELTMAQGYFLKHNNPEVVFDVFFREQPFDGGYSIFAGLEDCLDCIEGLRFSQDDLEYLEGTGLFKKEFLDYLTSFRFSGDIYAMEEGTPIFPGEPLVRVHSNIVEAQLIESLLLNVLNFQTLIATKAARVYLATKGGTVLEFGLRRAQGLDGALSATRAAFIGGAKATSNTYAGKVLGIPAKGTMAHSWIMAFENEYESFKAYADLYPHSTILLIDTYDTLGSGLRNAIKIGQKLKTKGFNVGIRLDSGDLCYLSIQARKALDKAGLEDASIAVSNDLDEVIINQLVTDGAPIDIWGVGTKLVTGGNQGAFPGVYKLVAKSKNGIMVPTIKVSNNPEKTTTPGIKQVYRFSDQDGIALADLITFIDEDQPDHKSITFYHPKFDYKHFQMESHASVKPLLSKKFDNGQKVGQAKNLQEIQKNTLSQLDCLDSTYKRLINPHIYKVSLSIKVKNKKVDMINDYSNGVHN